MNEKVYVFLAEGFEEIEALTPVDVLRRAGLDVLTVSITDNRDVKGAHGVTVRADLAWDQTGGCPDALCLVLPGGLPGASNLAAFAPLNDLLIKQHARRGFIAAICASPAFVLAPLGILDDTEWTGYPGCEQGLSPAALEGYAPGRHACARGHVITGEGPACALLWSYLTVYNLVGDNAAEAVEEEMIYDPSWE